MKQVTWLLIFMAMGCWKRVWWPELVYDTEPCYTTKHKVTVYALPNRCPDQSDLERVTEEFLGRMGAPVWALENVDAHFVKSSLHTKIKGSKWEFTGYAPYDGLIVVKDQWLYSDRMDTYNHEMSHQLLYRSKQPLKDLHASYDCEDHMKLGAPHTDACKLLPVATDLSNKTALAPDNIYRKAFEQIPKPTPLP